ncbi:hypothetical protein NYE33_02480 [Paenibacillus sp. FSL R10-2199]|uniref:hypothetical protein n=1 Tax=Paenibacillus sp. FSL R10-2199 TaxID=2975348 RepID=UPI0030FC3EFF
MAAGTALFNLSIVGITIQMNPSTLLLFGIMDAVSRPVFDTPFGRISTELVVWRECALSVGRISSVGILVMLYKWTDPASTLGWFMLGIFL